MANLRDIRQRIRSIKNTAQITKAMQLVASAKMRRAQEQALAGRNFAQILGRVLADLPDDVGIDTHPFLRGNGRTEEVVLVISTDKGLCGPLNTNLLRKVRQETTDETTFVTVGKKLRHQLSRLQVKLGAAFTVDDPVVLSEARPIARYLADLFINGQAGKISLAYSKFINTLSQKPVIELLFPLSHEMLNEMATAPDPSAKARSQPMPRVAPSGTDFIFEPSATKILDSLLPLYVVNRVLQVMLEARASEHSARMVAMKTASDNAKNLIRELTLDYNKIRQASITSELLEITTAMKAIE